MQCQNKILKYKLTPEQCRSTPKSRSQSSTPRSFKSITKSQQTTPKRVLHYQLTVQQCKELNENSEPATPSKSLTPSKSSIKTNKTENIENNKQIDNNIISSRCSERRYEYSYPYLTEYQPFIKDDIKIARCVSGTRDALLLADYLRIMSPKKKTVYDYSVKPCDNNKPIPKYTGNVKFLSPSKTREVKSVYI